MRDNAAVITKNYLTLLLLVTTESESCFPAELVTLHLMNQKSYYFIRKKLLFLTTLPKYILLLFSDKPDAYLGRLHLCYRERINYEHFCR